MALVSASTVSTGDVLAASTYNTQVIGNLNDLYASRRLGYQTASSNYTSDQTTLSMANMFGTSITWTADGTSTYWIEFFCPRLVLANSAGQAVSLMLVDGSGTGLGCAAVILGGSATGNQMPVHAKIPYTPASGSRTINFRAPYTAGLATSVWYTGTGGSTLTSTWPMWMAVYGPALT